MTLVREGGGTDEVTMVRESLGKVTRTKDLYLSLAALKGATERKGFHPDQIPALLCKVEEHLAAVEDGRDEGERKLREHINELEGVLEEQLGAANLLLRRREEKIFRLQPFPFPLHSWLSSHHSRTTLAGLSSCACSNVAGVQDVTARLGPLRFVS